MHEYDVYYPTTIVLDGQLTTGEMILHVRATNKAKAKAQAVSFAREKCLTTPYKNPFVGLRVVQINNS